MAWFDGAGARFGAAGLQAALLQARVALGALRDALARTERELAAERQHLEDAVRRGRLAEAVPDAETVQVAGRFAARHRERVTVLERKHGVQRDELVLAEREYEEMTMQLRMVLSRAEPGDSRTHGSDSGTPRGDPKEGDSIGDLLQTRLDRAGLEAAAEAQLARLKKKLGKDKT